MLVWVSKGLTVVLLACFWHVNASFLDNFLPSRPENEVTPPPVLSDLPAVPFEMQERDERFIQEGSVLSSQSGVDLCHHRVVLKLQKSCRELTTEEQGKLAVTLLNCQSVSEDRPIFECSDSMTLKQCTAPMTPDAYNAYLILATRVQSVCSSVRLEQFRTFTELAVNKLAAASRQQISHLDQISEVHEGLRKSTSEALQDLVEKHEILRERQADIVASLMAQRSAVQRNTQEILKEKALILSGKLDISGALRDLKESIGANLRELETKALELKSTHDSDSEELLRSLERLRLEIEGANRDVAGLKRETEDQTEVTLRKLKRINETVHTIAEMVVFIQLNIEDLAARLGGSEFLSLYGATLLIYAGYFLFGMLCLSFISATLFARLAFIVLVPLNLLATIYDQFSLDLPTLTGTILGLIFGQILLKLAPKMSFKGFTSMEEPTRNGSLKNGRVPEQVPKREPPVASRRAAPVDDDDDYYAVRQPVVREISIARELTPALSRRSGTPFSTSSIERLQCVASTARGEQCRNAAKDGDFCRVHQRIL